MIDAIAIDIITIRYEKIAYKLGILRKVFFKKSIIYKSNFIISFFYPSLILRLVSKYKLSFLICELSECSLYMSKLSITKYNSSSIKLCK